MPLHFLARFGSWALRTPERLRRSISRRELGYQSRACRLRMSWRIPSFRSLALFDRETPFGKMPACIAAEECLPLLPTWAGADVWPRAVRLGRAIAMTLHCHGSGARSRAARVLLEIAPTVLLIAGNAFLTGQIIAINSGALFC